ncbi:hypothetical protein F6R98_10980 [Candidatus Methylospira mobilis]|uniref:Uncharacterized protein n=1 Tax=Candidatus Methylospira mobilis TaxID=1808979 RepID=A0A5Q0BLS9_9GAMM|nr:hypothetical protein [Candidatus Methylospira mobilis]QFY43078.1 hypothetical protein F6R98_10980 [Candidatus Methylospira mobilis]
MIFQPSIIALLLASGLGVGMLLTATPFALQVIRYWDIGSGSELQLTLERRIYLFSTLVTFVLALQLVSLLLFVFNADRMAVMFVGAMCAVGTLNANSYGFPALSAQTAMFFLASMWLTINHVDTRGRDYPLVKIKYGLLIAMLPMLAAVLMLQWRYFSGLRTDIITSCCGSLFSSEAHGLSGDLSALPPGLALIAFYGSLTLVVGAAVFYSRYRRGGYVVAAGSAAAMFVAVAGILSFLSLYLYEHPHHHCPFCILKPEYDYQGYWLYVPLFTATAAGLGIGAIQPFRGMASLSDIVPEVSVRLAAVAVGGYLLFAAIATLMVGRSNLILLE